MKYYHIAFNTPFGPGTFFYRGEGHPLMPNTYIDRTSGIASKLSLQYATNVAPEAVVYMAIDELPIEVARARWPEDFVEEHPNLCLAKCGNETADNSGICPWCQKKESRPFLDITRAANGKT